MSDPLESKMNLPPLVKEEEVEVIDVELVPNLPDVPKPAEIIEASATDPDEGQFDEDFVIARDNILNVIAKVNEAATLMNEIAKDKEDAKSFDSLNGLYKTILAATATLVDVHRRKTDQKKGVPSTNGAVPAVTNIQNAIFTGTAKDLQDLVNKTRRRDD